MLHQEVTIRRFFQHGVVGRCRLDNPALVVRELHEGHTATGWGVPDVTQTNTIEVFRAERRVLFKALHTAESTCVEGLSGYRSTVYMCTCGGISRGVTCGEACFTKGVTYGGIDVRRGITGIPAQKCGAHVYMRRNRSRWCK